MKLVIAFWMFFALSAVEWLSNFEEAKEIARDKKQYILLNFSGSDWCAACITMKREVFSSETFLSYASQNLVLVRADFPRLKKNRLADAQVKRNESLADRYNPHGKFPFTLLLDAQGKVMATWDGYTSATPQIFIEQIQKHTANP